MEAVPVRLLAALRAERNDDTDALDSGDAQGLDRVRNEDVLDSGVVGVPTALDSGVETRRDCIAFSTAMDFSAAALLGSTRRLL